MLLGDISLFSGMSGASENSQDDFGRRPFSLPNPPSVIDRVLSEGSVLVFVHLPEGIYN